MSIFIAIAQEPQSGNRTAFSRGLRISRMSHTTVLHPDSDDVLTYEVIYMQSMDPRSKPLAAAMFKHRYADSPSKLLSEALDALHEAHPHLIMGRKP